VSLFIASVLLAAAAAAAVVLPILTRRQATLRDVTAGHVLDAEARKRIVLQELKELEYDWLGGKLDDADYHQLRERVSTEAVAAIRAVEAVGAEGSGAGGALRVAIAGVADHECGFANPAGSRFCGGCGAELS
jgi:cytochrome c-type biogenesis protein CcmI